MDDVYFVPRELGEKVHKRHFPARGAELTAVTQEHADFTCSFDSYIERLRSLDMSFFCASAVPVFVHVPGTKTVVGDTAHWCADAAMWANLSVPPSMVLVIMGSLPNVNPAVVDNKEFVFPEIAGSECQTCGVYDPVAVVDTKVFVFREIATYVCQTCHPTSDLVSATPPSAHHQCSLASQDIRPRWMI